MRGIVAFILLFLIAYCVLFVHSAPKRDKEKENGGKINIEDTDTTAIEESTSGKKDKSDLKGLRDKLQGPKQKKNAPPGFEKPKKKKLSQEEKGKIKASCGRKKGGCKSQSEKSKADKSQNHNRRLNAKLSKLKGGKNTTNAKQEAELKVQREIQKTFEAKKAVLKAMGITDDEVIPYDDGVWEEDIFLTEEQSERIIQLANITTPSQPPVLPGTEEARKRKKRFAIFVENDIVRRWDINPIPVVLDPRFSPEQKGVILNSLNDIQSKTCIKFNEIDELPETSHILYVRDDGLYGSCGLANLGKTDEQNLVWLNFLNCSKRIEGIIIHESLHALGMLHHHVRHDRNEKLTINYDNLDAQVLDWYKEADTDEFTSYGVPYDYFSIMHYSAYAGAIDKTVNVLRAVDEPSEFFTEVMGQRKGLSDKDAELLRKMYCSKDCKDELAWCGSWSTVDYCKIHTQTMIEYCPKSCGFCPQNVNLDALNKAIPEEQASFLF